MTSNGNIRQITNKEITQMFFRTMSYNASFNYERQLCLGWVYGIAPVLKKLYGDDKEEMAKALQRHMVFNNITPYISPLLFGITAALEEENCNNKDFDVDLINQTKVSLMGPLSAVGDSIFFSTIRVIASSVGATMAATSGSPIGAIIFFLIFNIPNLLCRWYLGPIGYKFGASLVNKAEESGLLNRIFKVTTILGLTVIGAMVAKSVSVPLNITFYGQNLLDIINGIMPALLSLGLFELILYLLKKDIKVTTILWGIIIFGIVGAFVGIF